MGSKTVEMVIPVAVETKGREGEHEKGYSFKSSQERRSMTFQMRLTNSMRKVRSRKGRTRYRFS